MVPTVPGRQGEGRGGEGREGKGYRKVKEKVVGVGHHPITVVVPEIIIILCLPLNYPLAGVLLLLLLPGGRERVHPVQPGFRF